MRTNREHHRFDQDYFNGCGRRHRRRSRSRREASHRRKCCSPPCSGCSTLMFVMVSASGLMATAQIAPIAADFKVGDQIVFWGATTLTAALIIDNIANGTARPLFGWISDNIGRELTMALAFGLGGISYWLLGTLGTAPWAFVLFADLIFLTWGEMPLSLDLHRHVWA